jgi:DNA-binding PadR family transcriptional regulator
MSLPHALITALVEQPSSGSDLASRFDRSIGYFWHATHQQIYRELGRLEEAGWVESLPPESGRGRKKVYQVLPAGRAELQRWVAEDQDPQPQRNEFMVRLRAEAVVGPTGLASDIERRLALHREKLTLYRDIEARDFGREGATRKAQLQHLVLDAGIMQETLWIEFSEKALKILAHSDDPLLG